MINQPMVYLYGGIPKDDRWLLKWYLPILINHGLINHGLPLCLMVKSSCLAGLDPYLLDGVNPPL